MYMTGFADETSPSLDTQIQVTKELGWRDIESRNVQVDDFPAGNIHDISDTAFDRLAVKLEAAGIRINCFGSAIGNWSKHIDQPFETSLAEVRRSIPRMQKLGTKLVRIMSFAVRDGDDQMEVERFKRVREIHRMFADAGLTAVHENCMNYGGMGWQFTLKLLENVPGLKLVFDTGNPVDSDDRSKPSPYPKQSSWEFYSHVHEHVAYIHIKDGIYDAATKKTIFTYPGEGHGDIPKIIKDLFAHGYDGGISIEPHMGAVFHDPNSQHSLNAAEIYVEYGRRMLKMVNNIRTELRLPPYR
ncbi:MAG: sugar phosphate isomerase/epimerase [Verrucomicrobia bacterium]|nr:sugar phosphate isomerase/epimerase [Verrucomicrobiota bacterium]MBU1734851.1 sugar phosphate isomerase/epimerase [Verrucomicrobiota bacterium]MBU1857499.1 sugar phosphate isomerase/epimerase [Verrucomicrobiota bacterium]